MKFIKGFHIWYLKRKKRRQGSPKLLTLSNWKNGLSCWDEECQEKQFWGKILVRGTFQDLICTTTCFLSGNIHGWQTHGKLYGSQNEKGGPVCSRLPGVPGGRHRCSGTCPDAEEGQVGRYLKGNDRFFVSHIHVQEIYKSYSKVKIKCSLF